MKRQAMKAIPAQIKLHSLRREVFGQNMARNADRPRHFELLVVTGVVLLALVRAAYLGWFL